MNIEGTAGNLGIFMGESDTVNGMPLYEAIVRAAREAGLAGASVFKGVISFGASHSLQTMQEFNFSHDTPVLVEIVDDHTRLDSFFTILFQLMDESKKGGLVTLENVKVLRYRKGLKYTNYANS